MASKRKRCVVLTTGSYGGQSGYVPAIYCGTQKDWEDGFAEAMDLRWDLWSNAGLIARSRAIDLARSLGVPYAE